MKKKLLSLFLTLCLIVALLPVQALAAGETTVTTEADLRAAVAVDGFSVMLGGDITLTSDLEIIVSGTINGGGHTLSGGAVTTPDWPEVTVKLAISSLTITNAGGRGLYVGYPHGNGNKVQVTMTDCAIRGCAVSGIEYGGGAQNRGSLTMTRCTVENNTAEDGGGIYNYGTLSMMECRISGNKAERGGGISSEGGCVLENCIVTGNTASDRAGGISHSSAAFAINNSVVAGNYLIVDGAAVPSDLASYDAATLNAANSVVGVTMEDWKGNPIEFGYTSNSSVGDTPALGDIFTGVEEKAMDGAVITVPTANAQGEYPLKSDYATLVEQAVLPITKVEATQETFDEMLLHMGLERAIRVISNVPYTAYFAFEPLSARNYKAVGKTDLHMLDLQIYADQSGIKGPDIPIYYYIVREGLDPVIGSVTITIQKEKGGVENVDANAFDAAAKTLTYWRGTAVEWSFDGGSTWKTYPYDQWTGSTLTLPEEDFKAITPQYGILARDPGSLFRETGEPGKIEVTRQEKPAITITQANTAEGSATVSGLTTAMEQSGDGVTWTDCAEASCTLAQGETLYVRTKAAGSALASFPAALYAQRYNAQPEETPTAKIDYRNEVIKGLLPGGNYEINGVPVTASSQGTSPILPAWIGVGRNTTEIMVIKCGGEGKNNSAPQTLTVNPRRDAPYLFGFPESYPGAGDGVLTCGSLDGVLYREKGEIQWQIYEYDIHVPSGVYEAYIPASTSNFASCIATAEVGTYQQKVEETPSAVLKGETVAGLLPGAVYQIEGAEYTATAEGAVPLNPSWRGKVISVIKQGNGTTTKNSAAQSLGVPAENTYYITYDSNGGTGGPKDFIAHQSADTISVKLTPAPQREGYTFLGWASDSKAAEPLYKSDEPASFAMGDENVTLYAVWAAGEYTVTWNVDGVTSTSTLSAGEFPVYEGVPEKAGYYFTGWQPSLAPVTEDVTYTAQFTDQLKVLDVSAGHNIAISETEYYIYDGHVNTFPYTGAYKLTGVSETATVQIYGGSPSIILENLKLNLENGDGQYPFNVLRGATPNVTLVGENEITLKNPNREGDENRSAMHVPTGASITFTAASTGSLYVRGGEMAAGIGGDLTEDAGTVMIHGGTLEVVSGYGAAIGGGAGYQEQNYPGDGGHVLITGGRVTARCTEALGGAAIGGGGQYPLIPTYRTVTRGSGAGTVEISGGEVTVTGNPGIGSGGCSNEGGTVSVTGGFITAYRLEGGDAIGAAANSPSQVDVSLNNCIVMETAGEEYYENTIRFGTVYGGAALTKDLEILHETVLTVPEGSVLTIPESVTLTSYGTIQNSGEITGSGTIYGKVTGNAPAETVHYFPELPVVEVRTEEELRAAAASDMINVKLMADIDLSDGLNLEHSGKLDGNGHTITLTGPSENDCIFTYDDAVTVDISNLTVTAAEDRYYSLLINHNRNTMNLTNCLITGGRTGVVNNGAMTMTDCTVSNNSVVGVDCGTNTALVRCLVTGNSTGVIDNAYLLGSIVTGNVKDGGFPGGIRGQYNPFSISNSIVLGNYTIKDSTLTPSDLTCIGAEREIVSGSVVGVSLSGSDNSVAQTPGQTYDSQINESTTLNTVFANLSTTTVNGQAITAPVVDNTKRGAAAVELTSEWAAKLAAQPTPILTVEGFHGPYNNDHGAMMRAGITVTSSLPYTAYFSDTEELTAANYLEKGTTEQYEIELNDEAGQKTVWYCIVRDGLPPETGSTEIVVTKGEREPFSGQGLSFDAESMMVQGVYREMEYSVDNGTTWTPCTAVTDNCAAVSGVTAEGDILVRYGENRIFLASEWVKVEVEQKEKPMNLKAFPPNSAEGKGTISGVDGTMEYSVDHGETWNLCAGSEIVGIDQGAFCLVRGKAAGNALASEPIQLTVPMYGAMPAAAPNAQISFADETLTGLTPDGKYTINGGEVTADENGKINIDADWLDTTVSIIAVGDGISILDSEAQELQIPDRPTAPTVTATNETYPGAEDGKLSTDNTMEYRVGAGEWTPCTGEVTGLAAGTYCVRLKATASAFASAGVEVTVGSDPAKTYTVTLNTDGGTINSGSVTSYTYGTGAALPTDVTKEGFTFGGWYEAEDCSGSPVTQIPADAAGNMTFYAKWTKKSKPVTPGPAIPDSEDPPIPPVWENPFTDVQESDWYYAAVEFANENGLFYGTSNTTFEPNGDMTRGMLATVLYRLAEEPETTAEDLFSDVEAGKYYTEAVTWAAEHDIVAGYGNGRYGPEDSITREQLATILWRYAGSPESTGSLDGFHDGAKTSDWAIPALQWAVEQGIVSGRGNGILDPKGQATRAEVASMLMRYCGMKQ